MGFSNYLFFSCSLSVVEVKSMEWRLLEYLSVCIRVKEQNEETLPLPRATRIMLGLYSLQVTISGHSICLCYPFLPFTIIKYLVKLYVNSQLCVESYIFNLYKLVLFLYYCSVLRSKVCPVR